MHLPMSRRSRCLSALLVAGGLSAALVACQKDTSASRPTAAADPVPASTAKRRVIPDGDIAEAVRRYLQEDNALRSEHVQVAVSGGVATISGSVSNLLASERALSVTETVRGVRSVIDQVAVTPVATTDERLTAAVTEALRHDVATRPYTITVAAKDGVVTLSGAADSWQQRTLFTEVAKAVPGVKSIVSAVAIHYGRIRTESEVAADVKHRIANDVWLDGNALGVTVTGHTVHVNGLVGSVAQRSRARSDGWVEGVEAVDDSGIIVDWFARNDQRLAMDYPAKSDAEISQALRDAFRLDPRLRTLIPQAAVVYGMVTLSGTVDSGKARSAAESDARDTLGVWSVRNEVIVQPAGKPTDADIEREVKRVLGEDLGLRNGKSIGVSSSNGKVALTGTLTSGFERFDVIADVGSVPGVAEIDDGMTVTRPPAEVKVSIEDRLFWDPMVQRDRVNVAVAPDGVATLSGTLDSWGEIKAAANDALRGGATRVVNVLKLRNHPEVVAR